jgi:hypothetical protein
MRLIRRVSWLSLVFVAAWGLWSQPVTALPPPAEQKDLLAKAREEIAASSAGLDEALAQLSHTAYAQPPAVSSPDAVIPWLRAVAARGVADSNLVRGSLETLDAWIAGLNDGSRVITPAADLPVAMEQWRTHKSQALDRIREAAKAEEDRQHGQTAMAQAKTDSPEWTQARDTEQQRAKEVAAALHAAQAALESPLSIPKPFSATDRGTSPFAATLNPGEASAIWLYANRSSAMIGEAIEVQIGFANDNGPNCAASKHYAMELKCTGCEVPPGIALEQGERFRTTAVRITSKASSLKVSGAGLKDREINLTGCVFHPKVHLADRILNGSAPADGITPAAVLAIFQNDAGDPATDGHQKTLDLSPSGPGVKFNPAQQDGHILRDGREMLDIDECASRQDLVSDHAGAATLGIRFGNDNLNPSPQFHFLYIWRFEDIEYWLIGALIGWLATCGKALYKGPRKAEEISIRIAASLLASLAGAGILLEAAYLILSHFNSVSDPHVPCAIAGVLGGALGLPVLYKLDDYWSARKAAEQAE